MDSQARRQVQLQGAKPAALMVNRNSTKIKKQQHVPVIVHLRSPKVIHVRPEEFMGLVQHLTGNPVSAAHAPAAAARCPNHHAASGMKATPPKMEKRSPVVTMDQSQQEDLMGGVEPRGLSFDFHALMHFVDFV